MKIKSIIICAVLAIVLCLAGCRDANGKKLTPTGAASSTRSSAATIDPAVTTTVIENINGTTAVEGNPPTAETIYGLGVSATDISVISEVDVSSRTPTMTSETNSEIFPAIAFSIPTNNNIDKIDNKKIGWGLGPDRNSSGRPLDAEAANEKYQIYNARFIEKDENKIYLTFDEGYENGFTPSILDTLKEKKVKATFFVTYDYCKNHPELVKRMANEGHTVGNHSYSHPSFPDCEPGKVNDEITMLHDYVNKNFGIKMNVIRFPMGEFSDRTLAIADNLGYKSIFWSFAYMDWDVNNQPSPLEAYKKITDSTHPGAIVLLHAVSSANTACLGKVIDYWHGSGYKIVAY
ncbi:MAG: polysaccharide deacetylase family protein [Eubacterium sp.]|jgi:peptidoglycan-N-acetylmuramic acid deacetylase|nr:polysaccharide deacetylase family protein [Eubacterium sp.]